MDSAVEVGGLLQPRLDFAVPAGTPSFAIDRVRLDVGGEHKPDAGPLLIKERVIVELMPQPKLLDAWLQVGPKAVSLCVGQMKTPISRANATPDAQQLLPWSTLQGGYITKRDLGAMITGAPGDSGKLEYQLGAFDGEGSLVVGNANRGLMLAGRVVWSPLGGPGTRSELLHKWGPKGSGPKTTTSFGLAGHRDVLGTPGTRVGILGVNGEFFLHRGLFSGEAEALARWFNAEAAGLPDYEQQAYYAQVGVFVPGTWTSDHLALLARYEVGDPFESEFAPIVDDTHPAPEPHTRREELAVGFYVGEPLFKDVQAAHVVVGYRASQELEGTPVPNDQVSIAANLAF